MKNVTVLNKLIYTGVKLVCEKIRVLLKNKLKFKTWMGN